MKYDVIISILVWDTPEYIKNLLVSLLINQSHTYSSKIMLLDQGSDKETKSVVSNYSNSLHIVQLSKNIGFAKGHNLIFNLASQSYEFEYFCCINSDIIIEEEFWIDGLIIEFEKHKNVGIVGPTALSIDKFGDGNYASDNNFDVIAGSLFLTKRSIIDKYGLFDEAFTPAYFEDTDLNLRYKKLGLKLIKYPILHRHNYLQSIPKTAINKKKELINEFGNFFKKNQKRFLLRWAWRGYEKGDYKWIFIGIITLIQYLFVDNFNRMKIFSFQFLRKINLIKN